ncbi:MAG: substrate-binding domain-containing protein [Desulfobulbaceae bacterium]|nr:substrate-binding domain-containing protein [Desulfobulbaceae bacterium]
MTARKKFLLFSLFPLLLISMFFIASGCGKKTEEKITAIEIAGTGACENILQFLAAAFNQTNPGLEVIVPPSIGSTGGIKAVGEGTYVLGRVARHLKEEESHYGLTYLPFASDAVGFTVSHDVPIKSLTEDEIVAIFKGEIVHWNQVGGPDRVITLFVREKEDSSRAIIAKHIPAFKDMTHPITTRIFYNDNKMIEMLSKYHGSIGWTTKSGIAGNNQVQMISVNGAEPSRENTLTGVYPLAGDYALIYKKGNLNEIAQKFINFIFSDAGSSVLEEHGVTPLSR